jgi:glycolate oxidase FAD binding subunit
MAAGSGSPTATAQGAARRALEAVCGSVEEATASDQVDGVQPALVARPTSTEEVAEVLRAAAGHGLAVVPRGRGTKMSWGRPPARADLVLDVSRLDQVLDHAAGDLVVAAQAGTTLAQVQQVVSTADQRLAIDETVPGASIGGTLAAATSGPSRMAYGTFRDLLIGVTVVRADGVVAKAGGRVVKNVAGYDLGKLVGGSFGTLAVVTEALFRLHPVPAARRFVCVPVATVQEAHRLSQVMVHSQVVPTAVELDWAGGRGSLGVLLEGVPGAVEGRAATAASLLGDSATVSEDAPPGWGRYPWPLESTGDDRQVAMKLTFALSGLPDVLTAVEGAGVPVSLRGSAGAGVLYAAVPGGTDPAALVPVVERIRAACVRHGGALVVLDGPAGAKEALDTWGPVSGLELMRRVKDQFDPDHRLAPGRFVGGI